MKKREKKPDWFWDLEATEWDQPLCCVAWSSDGDIERFWGPKCLEAMWKHMQKTGGTYIAHFGGGYDVPMLMQHAGARPEEIVLSGSTILAGRFGRRLTLRDSYPATLAPLAKLGEWVGLPKLDLDRSHLERFSKEETLKYCERDCEILMKAIGAQQEYLAGLDAKKAWTAGSAAVSILEALEPATWARLKRAKLKYKNILRPLEGVRGGRVECWARGQREKVWSYDFKSSYPARYAKTPVGIGLRHAVEGDTEGIFLCAWHWPHRRRRPPALDASGAGAGYCCNWLVGEEIRAFAECGVAVEVREGYAPTSTIPCGQEFAAELYAQKESGSPWAKVFLNSLHGKFSEHPVKDSWTLEHPQESYSRIPTLHGEYWSWLTLATDKHGYCPPHAQPIAAAQILGRARVGLWEAFREIERTGHEIYYCDTDSIHTSCPPEELPIKLGKELGDLDLECGPCTGYYLGPKAYLLVDVNGKVEKSALKGVPLKTLIKGVREKRRGTKATDLWRGADTEKELATATDLREEIFRDAIENPYGVAMRKEGVSSFVRGLKALPSSSWEKESSERTISFTGRGKSYEGPECIDWRYLTPTECAAKNPLLDPQGESTEYEWLF